jgi:hypothetical protein
MSSILRTYSQIPARAKHLIGITDGSIGPFSEISAFTLSPGEFINMTSVATEEDISGLLGFVILGDISGNLYKDLGRQVTVYDPATHAHLAVFRQVQLVNGLDTEGVCAAVNRCATIYMKVWSSNGVGVVVVRVP